MKGIIYTPLSGETATTSEIHEKLLGSMRYISCFCSRVLWSCFHSLWLHILYNTCRSLADLQLPQRVTDTADSDVTWCADRMRLAYGVIEWSQRLQHGSRAGGSVTCWGTLEGTPLPLDPTAPSPGTPLSVLPPLASHQRFCTIWLNQVPWGSVPLRRQTFWEWALIGYNLLIVPRMLMFLFLIWQYLGASQSSPRNPPCRRW